MATSQELPAIEDQASQGNADADIPADIQGAEAVEREFPEDVSQEVQAETRSALGEQPDGGGLQDANLRPAEPEGDPPALPDIEFPEDRQGQYQDQPLPQDFRAEYRDSIGEPQGGETGWQGGPSESRLQARQPQPIELPSDFDERLRFAIQPELDQLQDALGSRTSDILAENALLVSLSVVPE